MSIADDFIEMIKSLTAKFEIPNITKAFFPKLYPEGQPKSAEFMAIGLESGSVGVSFIMNSDLDSKEYESLTEEQFIGKNPVEYALKFGSSNGVDKMLALAATNAICQHIMKVENFQLDYTTDSLGLIDVKENDTVGMVGFFAPLIGMIKKAGAKLKIIEKKEHIIKKFPNFDISLDPANLESCNKVLCTSTTVLNNTLDNIISHCKNASLISIIGPTAGYFPDPLFKRGVTVVGGTYVGDDALYFDSIRNGEKWGSSAKKYCIRSDTYKGYSQFLK